MLWLNIQTLRYFVFLSIILIFYHFQWYLTKITNLSIYTLKYLCVSGYIRDISQFDLDYFSNSTYLKKYFFTNISNLKLWNILNMIKKNRCQRNVFILQNSTFWIVYSLMFNYNLRKSNTENLCLFIRKKGKSRRIKICIVTYKNHKIRMGMSFFSFRLFTPLHQYMIIFVYQKNVNTKISHQLFDYKITFVNSHR